MWIRLSRFSSSCCSRRVTTSSRKSRKCCEDALEVEPVGDGHLGPLGRQQAGQVDVEVGLERRVLEQVGQRRVGVRAGAQLQRDPDVVGAQVLDVRQLRHLPLADQLADPLHQGVLLDPVGDRR